MYWRQDLIYQFSTVVIKGLKVLKNIAELLSPGHSLMVSSIVLAPFASALVALGCKMAIGMLGSLVLDVGLPAIKNCIGTEEFVFQWYPNPGYTGLKSLELLCNLPQLL